MNEVPIQQFYALPYDRWEGYAAERTKLLTFLKENVKNAVFLTTDVHANMVNDARLQTLEPGRPGQLGHHRRDDRARSRPRPSPARSTTRSATRAAGTLIRALFFNAAAAERRRDAVLGPRPVQLRRGLGHQQRAHRAAQGHRRKTGPEHRRPHQTGGALRHDRHPCAVSALKCHLCRKGRWS